MKKSKYEENFEELERVIEILWSMAVHSSNSSNQTDRQLVSAVLRADANEEITKLKKAIEKLERENIGLKQTNLNQKEKLEKYFNGIK